MRNLEFLLKEQGASHAADTAAEAGSDLLQNTGFIPLKGGGR
jgi:hypothetical protein